MMGVTLPHPSEWEAIPRIYEPWTPPNSSPRYSITAPAGLIDDLARIHHRNGRVTIARPSRPEVLPGDRGIEWLVRELARRDARNLSRDTLLAEHQLRVWFERRPLPARFGRAGDYLFLHKVKIL